MAEFSKIEWTDHTFNPWIGCTKVSPACDNCYAEGLMDHRYGRARWGAGEPRVRTAASNWSQPRKWDRQAAKTGERPFVFCASLADVFDNEVDETWRRDLFKLIEGTPNLVWLLLTKRIGNVMKMAGGMTELDDIEQNARRLLISAQEAAIAMAELFAEQGRGADRDNWKAVEGLLDQALGRFRE